LTRKDKEEDRIRHVATVNAQTGPVFISYRERKNLNTIVDEITSSHPEYDFAAEDGVQHTVWIVNDAKQIEEISKEFSEVESLYIADGHHRAAAAATIARVRRSKDKSVVSVKEYESVLAVFFPHTQLKVMDYNRAVKDLNGLTSEKFIEKISAFLQLQKTLQPGRHKNFMIWGCIWKGSGIR